MYAKTSIAIHRRFNGPYARLFVKNQMKKPAVSFGWSLVRGVGGTGDYLEKIIGGCGKVQRGGTAKNVT